MKKILSLYLDNQGKAMIVAAILAIVLGYMAYVPNAEARGSLYYFLQLMAIPADFFKAII